MRTAVLTAALDELADYGYTGINMQRLAERAQVNKTTLYRRWGTKGALIADALIAGSEGLEPVDT
ncbi:MAG TPA: helix-turn-helix domain-containing protein, partial [Acidimicrobiales bacterium]|nr:helix-turn-helix domain-containing protein [Acidimicrobiales bacterium]